MLCTYEIVRSGKVVNLCSHSIDLDQKLYCHSHNFNLAGHPVHIHALVHCISKVPFLPLRL